MAWLKVSETSGGVTIDAIVEEPSNAVAPVSSDVAVTAVG